MVRFREATRSLVRMAKKEPVARLLASSLVQQALREVLWGDLVATELPKHLRKDVEGVRGLEGNFLVDGVKVEVEKIKGGEVSVEDWRRGYEAFEKNLKIPKMGTVLKLERNTAKRRWEMRCMATNNMFMYWKLGGGRRRMRVIVDGWVEQGGLVLSPKKGQKFEVRAREMTGEGGIITTWDIRAGNGQMDISLKVTYMTRRV